MREETQTCCDPIEQQDDTPVAELNFIIEPFYPEFRYVNIVGDSLVVMSAEGRAFVTFVVDRTELKPNYMNLSLIHILFDVPLSEGRHKN